MFHEHNHKQLLCHQHQNHYHHVFALRSSLHQGARCLEGNEVDQTQQSQENRLGDREALDLLKLGRGILRLAHGVTGAISRQHDRVRPPAKRFWHVHMSVYQSLRCVTMQTIT